MKTAMTTTTTTTITTTTTMTMMTVVVETSKGIIVEMKAQARSKESQMKLLKRDISRLNGQKDRWTTNERAKQDL